MRTSLVIGTLVLLLVGCSSLSGGSLTDEEKGVATFFSKALCVSDKLQSTMSQAQAGGDQAKIDEATKGYQAEVEGLQKEAETLKLNDQTYMKKFFERFQSDKNARGSFITTVASGAKQQCNMAEDNTVFQEFKQSMEQLTPEADAQSSDQVAPTQAVSTPAN